MHSSASIVLQQTSQGVFRPLNEVSRKILEHGWAPSTVRQYAASVNKFFKFTDGSHPTFPALADSIYQFVLWCGKDDNKQSVISNTTRRYLTGLRMWHTLHGVPFPTLDEHRLRLVLKATKKCEPSQRVRKRLGLTLPDIHSLITNLPKKSLRCATLKAVVLVGFWGLARLGELTHHKDHPNVFVRRRDVRFSPDNKSASIMLRMAKTAEPSAAQ